MNYMEEYMQRMVFLMDFHIDTFQNKKMPICHITSGYFEYKNLNMCFVNDMVARIAEALYQGYLPVVEVPGGEGLENLWGAFFKQPHEILEIDYDAYAKDAEHVYEIEPVWGPGYKANLIPRELMCSRNLYRELVVLNERSDAYISNEISNIIGDKKLLGVLVRGTDLGREHPENHPRQPEWDQLLTDITKELKTNAYDGIYLASDEEKTEQMLKKALPDIQIYTNKRHYLSALFEDAKNKKESTILTDVMEENQVDLYTYGLEYLSSLYLLSKCESLIAGNTLGSSAALFLNGNQYRFYKLYDLGFYGENKDRALIFVKGALETLDYFAEQMINAAKCINRPCYVIDISKPETYNGMGLDTFVSEHDCLAIMFNQVGVMFEDTSGVNYWDAKGIPVFSMQVDHPRNFADALTDPIQMLHVLSIDRNHVKFIRRFFPNVKRNFFLPNGGAIAASVKENGYKKLKDRSIDILIVGDCQQEVTTFPKIEAFDDGGELFFGYCVQKMMTDPSLTTEEAIESFFLEYGFDVPDETLREFYTSVSIFIETYVRREWKQKMIRALDEVGISIEIYGRNWSAPDYSLSERIHIHERISSAECNEKIADAKITLNCMPWYKRGSSERPFNTMLNGSLCFIDPSEYLLERFEDGKEISFFDIQKPEELAQKLKYYLEHLDEAQEIANRALDAVMENDTWECRLNTILAMQDEVYGHAV